MRLKQFLEIFSEDRYVPTKDEIRHFNQVRSGGKIDYSKDVLNVVLKRLYNITLKISDEKIRDKFSHLIYRNMGDLNKLISEVKDFDLKNPTNISKDLREYISNLEN